MKNPLRNLLKDAWVFTSLLVVFLFLMIAILAYLISPDDSRDANQMHLSLPSAPALFRVEMLKIPNQTTSQNWVNALFFGKKNPHTETPIIGKEIKDSLVIVHLYPSGFEKKFSRKIFGDSEEISSIKTFWLGTDKYGRDILSRLIIGTRVSLSIGIVAVITSLIIGILMGSLAGYFGGFIDTFISWIINITWSIPTILLVLSISLALGKGFWQIFVAVGLTMWVEVARVVRGQFMSIKQNDYIKAAKVMGFPSLRIILHHILPNCISSLLIISAANFSTAILVESGLSFLGIGTQPPTPSWGSMIKQQYGDIILGKPLSAIAPGVCILLLVTSIMILSNKMQMNQART